ncbi:MAG: flagellar motor protein MotB [Thermodesulfobacteriota bacterium]|nr:flagellar motor protein MotB [Thermodesulfobacteriota bacterium]
MLKLDRKELKDRLELSERKRIQLQKKMVAQKTMGEEVPLWTMVDLMTLLLIFFIFLYSPYIKGSLSASNNPPEDRSTVQIKTSPASQQTTDMKTVVQPDLTRPPDLPVHSQSKMLDKTIKQLHLEILNTVEEVDKDVFSVRNNQHRLVFVLGERITFNVGKAKLLESYKIIFIRIANFISSKPGYQVVVSGHTDNTPINTEKYPSNLELSSARAINVAKFLIDNGVSPHRVSIQGFSEYRTLFENTSLKNRQANRRVEIALIKEQKGT